MAIVAMATKAKRISTAYHKRLMIMKTLNSRSFYFLYHDFHKTVTGVVPLLAILWDCSLEILVNICLPSGLSIKTVLVGVSISHLIRITSNKISISETIGTAIKVLIIPLSLWGESDSKLGAEKLPWIRVRSKIRPGIILASILEITKSQLHKYLANLQKWIKTNKRKIEIIVHSVENQKNLCHSDFTWNQIQSQKLLFSMIDFA